MIKLSESAIMIIAPNGSKYDFESDELQARIIKSCLSAGMRDLWIAEDITLSIEYALKTSKKENKEYTLSDINSIVLRILEETGYANVAEKFRLENSSSELEISPDPKLLSELTKRHLGLYGAKLDDVVKQLIKDAALLKIEKASPVFFVELAKIHKQKLLSMNDIKPVAASGAARKDTWHIARSDILEGISGKSHKLIDARVINITGVSRLFPAIKIDFSLMQFAELLELKKPLTEMAVIPHFCIPADAMNDIVTAAEKLYRNLLRIKGSPEKLPVYLSIDASSFASEYLDCCWPEGKDTCEDMLFYLRQMLNCNIFKVRLK